MEKETQSGFVSQWIAATCVAFGWNWKSFSAFLQFHPQPASPWAGHQFTLAGKTIGLVVVMAMVALLLKIQESTVPLAWLAMIAMIGYVGQALAWTVSSKQKNKTETEERK